MLTFYLTYIYINIYYHIVTDILSGEVRRGTLPPGARGSGPAGNTAKRNSRLRSGGQHCNPELTVEEEEEDT